MLPLLMQCLQDLMPEWRFLRVFQYITSRALFAGMTSLLIGIVLGPWVIRRLLELNIGQKVREYGPQHQLKNGTPTIGGGLILLSLALGVLLWGRLSNHYLWVVIVVTFSFGLIGWIDDWQKVVNKDPEGMRSGKKYFWQSIIGFLASVCLLLLLSVDQNHNFLSSWESWRNSNFAITLPESIQLTVPFFRAVPYPLGALGFLILTYLVIVGSSNSVNLTDGLDGLVILPVVLVSLALGVFAYISGNAVFSSYLFLPYVKGSGELLIFCAAMGGAGLAFLWFNAHPAQVFMGDVGALALGGALGTIAIIVRQELVLALMGGVFVIETVSVALQVLWFRYTKKRYGKGRRIFKMAPVHHHFEQNGWKESHIVVRFWIITIFLCLIGLSTLKLR